MPIRAPTSAAADDNFDFAATGDRGMSANFWWVNHSHTAQHEIAGSYLWFARKNPKSKARSESDKNTQRLHPGDIVFSFANAEIGAVGVVLGTAREAAKPTEFEAIAQHADADTGWLVPVRFMALENPLRTDEHCSELSIVLPRKHSPILASGGTNPHMHLAAVPSLLATTLQQLLRGEVERIVGTITDAVGRTLSEEIVETAIQQRTDIGPTQKTDFLKARHGQGAFRENVERNEHSCRITGVLDRRHLWATHIKPWFECDDGEKLDGFNGLLMSPHVADLFERGYISFSDDGDLLVSSELNPVVLEKWHIDVSMNVGPFQPEQSYYLDHHRREVFQQHGAGRRQKASDDFDAVPATLNAEPVVVHPA
jgi:putative restriction endonuclease